MNTTTKTDKKKTETLRAYKGFDLNFKCRDYQFEVGGEYKHKGAVVPCDSGFHACTKATDVWSYYPPAESRYAEVELSGKVVPHSGDSKHAASNIKIIRELTNKEFLALVIDEMFAEAKAEPDAPKGCPVCGTGKCKCETNASSGDSATNASSGHYAKNASSGHYAKNASSGDSATNASSGHYATNASSGHYAKNEAKGEHSVIAAAGANSQAKGAIGTWISLAEYKDKNCIGFAVGCIGQDGLKPDVWYKAQGGKLVEV
ncbi:MAG TPA: hypothetical protein VIX17_11690 [Pyrinomonadaceae bacterium]